MKSKKGQNFPVVQRKNTVQRTAQKTNQKNVQDAEFGEYAPGQSPEELALEEQAIEEAFEEAQERKHERDTKANEIVASFKSAYKTKTVTVPEIKVKLAKIKIAKKLAFTRRQRERVENDADDLLTNIDIKIKSLALNRFTVRKTQRLKALGKTRDDINDIIDELSISEDSIIDSSKNTVFGFGIDKRFIGLSVDDILDKVNAAQNHVNDEKNKNDQKKAKGKSNGKSNTNTNFIPQLLENKLKQDQTDTSKENDNLLNISLENNEEFDVIKNRLNNVENDVIDILDHITAPDKKNKNKFKYNKVKNEKLKINTDLITSTESNNEKIYNHLIKIGELDVADYILDLMTTPEKPIQNISDIKQNTEAIKHLSLINKGIYEKLNEIEENMVDEQDTSINLPKRIEQQKINQTTELLKASKDNSWLSSILEKLLGKSLMKMLLGAGENIGLLAAGILAAGSGFIKKIVKGIFEKSILPMKSLFDSVLKIISKVPGLGSSISAVTIASKLIFKPSKVSNEGFERISDISDLMMRKNELPNKTFPGANGSTTPNTPNTTINKNLPEPTDLKSLSNSKINPNAGKGIISKLTRFAKPIPLLGTALAAGTAIYAAVDGYNNASQYLQRPNNELGETEKLASAAGAVVNDASFGLIDIKSTAEKLIGMFGAKPKSSSSKVTGEIGDVKDYIKDNEGFRNNAYKDSLGLWTVGYGHLIKPGEENLMNGISTPEGERLFDKDFRAHENAAASIPGFNTYPSDIQKALTDMTFNMGPGWHKKWPSTMKMLESGDFAGAAEAMRNSKWAEQVGPRAENNALVIERAAQPVKISGSDLVLQIDNTKINGKQEAVTVLKSEQSKAGTPEKSANIQKAIDIKMREIGELKAQLNEAPQLSKSDIIKNKSMLSIEQSYINTIKNTKNYDIKSVGNQTLPQQTTINSVNTSKQESQNSAFELFDVLHTV